MRECGIGNGHLSLNIADNHAIWMRRKEELHDTQAGIIAHGGKHVGIPGYAWGSAVFLGHFELSRNIVLQYWKCGIPVKDTSLALGEFDAYFKGSSEESWVDSGSGNLPSE